jgi:hypothetical protein
MAGQSPRQNDLSWESPDTGSTRQNSSGLFNLRSLLSVLYQDSTRVKISAATSSSFANALESSQVLQIRCVASFHLFLIDSDCRQLYCLTADNATNNDSACRKIEQTIARRNLEEWDSNKTRLPYVVSVYSLERRQSAFT